MLGIRGHEPVFFQISPAFLYEFLMRCIRAYTGAKSLGQMEAFGISHVSAEKWPCPANIWLDGMDGTALSGPEKNTIPVFTRLYLPFSIPKNAVGIKESLFFEIQAFIKALQILGAQYYAAFPLAALTAHLAVKNSFFHDINSLEGVCVQP